MHTSHVLAFDFGASTGRAVVGSFDGQSLKLTEIHRFPNDPVTVDGTLHWDLPTLFGHIKQGLSVACRDFPIESLAVDTWGVDFGLLKNGALLENPVHYRDTRTNGMMNEVLSRLPRETVYQRTGIQFMEINTLYQLYSLVRQRPDFLAEADTMLFMPDLFAYLLTGVAQAEYTIASTSQLMTPKGQWAEDIFSALGLPARLLPAIVPTGTTAGTLTEALQKELHVPAVRVLHTAGHDTASAVVGCPAVDEDFAYISSGTWSLIGTERARALINERSSAYNFTNEGGYGMTTRLLKNIMGLWLIQESVRQWKREGESTDFEQLMQSAIEAPAFVSLVDPDDASFAPTGDMPERLRAFCRRTGQPVPATRGALMRMIYESLALAYRRSFAQLQEMTGVSFPRLHIIGGGSKDTLLSQFTADACGVPVECGPTEATALGNVAVQLMALGHITSLREARRVLRQSFEKNVYHPQNTAGWARAANRFEALLPV